MNKTIIALLALLIFTTSAYATDYGKGEEFYRRKLEKHPGDARLRYNLGGALHEESRYAPSIEEYLRSIGNFKKDLDKAGAYYNLGNSYFRLGDYEKAIKAYEDTLKITPEDEDAKYNLELAKKRLEEEKQKQQARQEQEKKEQEKKEQQEEKEQAQAKEESQEGMSEEDAQRILNALGEDEEDLMKLHQKVIRGKIVQPEKDW